MPRRMKNEETSAISSSVCGLRPGVVPRHKTWRHASKPLQIDAARARDVAEGQIERPEPHMQGKVRIPGCARLRGFDEFLDRWAMAGLIICNGCAEIIRVGFEGAHQRQYIFQGKSRSRSD